MRIVITRGYQNRNFTISTRPTETGPSIYDHEIFLIPSQENYIIQAPSSKIILPNSKYHMTHRRLPNFLLQPSPIRPSPRNLGQYLQNPKILTIKSFPLYQKATEPATTSTSKLYSGALPAYPSRGV